MHRCNNKAVRECVPNDTDNARQPVLTAESMSAARGLPSQPNGHSHQHICEGDGCSGVGTSVVITTESVVGGYECILSMELSHVSGESESERRRVWPHL